MNMTLTAEEKALIEQKRAEEKAKQVALLKSYDYHRENAIKRETERCRNYEADEEKLKEVYEGFLKQILEVSPDYKLHCKRVDRVNKIEIYDIDENGREITYKENSKGETVWLKPREVVKIPNYHYDLKLSYTGKVPEGHNYHIVAVEQRSKWSYRTTGYKMQVQGTGIDSWDKRGQMTNAKSVHKKIVDTIESAFIQIEYRTAQQQSNKRIHDMFKLEFSKYKNVEIDNNTFIVTLDNGIKVTFYGYEHGDEITFSSPKISLPYNKIEIKDLLDNLGNVKGKE
jgi:hypothetical protein